MLEKGRREQVGQRVGAHLRTATLPGLGGSPRRKEMRSKVLKGENVVFTCMKAINDGWTYIQYLSVAW